MHKKSIPPCAAFMGCLCAGHACGDPADAACDANEEGARARLAARTTFRWHRSPGIYQYRGSDFKTHGYAQRAGKKWVGIVYGPSGPFAGGTKITKTLRAAMAFVATKVRGRHIRAAKPLSLERDVEAACEDEQLRKSGVWS